MFFSLPLDGGRRLPQSVQKIREPMAAIFRFLCCEAGSKSSMEKVCVLRLPPKISDFFQRAKNLAGPATRNRGVPFQMKGGTGPCHLSTLRGSRAPSDLSAWQRKAACCGSWLGDGLRHPQRQFIIPQHQTRQPEAFVCSTPQDKGETGGAHCRMESILFTT